MRIIRILLLLLLSKLTIASQNCHHARFKTGKWRVVLHLNEKDRLPFDLLIENAGESYLFTIYNGDERITLNEPVFSEDSVFLRFPFFNSEIIITSSGKKSFRGEWRNYNKGSSYVIPLEASYGDQERFPSGNTHSGFDPSGKWEITFEPGTNTSYPAAGIFNSDENKLTGTFLTETGDYRFLAGNITRDSLYLSCFDGSHAFLFKAHFKNDTLYGKFLSGNHWSSEWKGFRNENFELRDPEKLTYVINSDSLRFTFRDLNGKDFTYPNPDLTNRVIIIQIMGSWCPNCLDETLYFKELYDNYHKDGLEIISIGYESSPTFEEQAASIARLRDKLSLNFTFLVGGQARKNLASEHFSMLNEVTSFPTTIFIGRDGKIKLVHTGFNGPGTGSYYTEYTERINFLVERLLAE